LPAQSLFVELITGRVERTIDFQAVKSAGVDISEGDFSGANL
jgi:hypothetical protein